MIRYEYIFGYSVPNRLANDKFCSSVTIMSNEELSAEEIFNRVLVNCIKTVLDSKGLNVGKEDVLLGFVSLVNKHKD